MPEIDVEELKRRYGTFDAPVTRERADDGEATAGKAPRPRRATAGDAATPAKRRRGSKAEAPGLVGIFADDPVRRAALNDCARLLTGGRAYTEFELRRKLVAKEHAPETVDEAIAKCIADRLIDDEAYAVSYVESRLRRGHGARKIRADLARRGIRGELVEPLLAEAREVGTTGDAALVAARKKFARVDLTDQKARAKAMRFLLGRGFDGGQASEAIRTLRAEAAEADDDA